MAMRAHIVYMQGKGKTPNTRVRVSHLVRHAAAWHRYVAKEASCMCHTRYTVCGIDVVAAPRSGERNDSIVLFFFQWFQSKNAAECRICFQILAISGGAANSVIIKLSLWTKLSMVPWTISRAPSFVRWKGLEMHQPNRGLLQQRSRPEQTCRGIYPLHRTLATNPQFRSNIAMAITSANATVSSR